MELPTFSEVLQAAPVAMIVMLVTYFGYWITSTIYNEHIKTLKDFVEYLKEKK